MAHWIIGMKEQIIDDLNGVMSDFLYINRSIPPCVLVHACVICSCFFMLLQNVMDLFCLLLSFFSTDVF